MTIDSIDVAKLAVKLAISSREEEKSLEAELRQKGILTVAVDVGGNINSSIPKIIERALVASKRNGIIEDCHVHDGAVVGATREAIMQVAAKANGLNVGGKIGIARYREHLSVCIFMSIGLLHLNEVVIGIGHRSIPNM
ncbi:MAG: HutP family protein [Clostridium argentinense]|uniref:Hut operon positive regulatory protein n=1 Tax=Clostridium faecium TaxID=2762223 RepID=A0ABR8YRR6_9CLOT|nr:MULTISPECIES: HutP family protein [Clostridium]MBD8046926.1 HutP family protein [Clostridium faecium]MBS5822333.1 HutP family protein [Clostridium argentinense]MDU1348491.1 HutP family protein [Clostridium argentinense]